MASPSRTSRKDGVKCDGKIKKGRREGQVCGKMLLKKDSPEEDPSIACPSPNSYCGKHKSFLALLSEAVDIWGEPFRKKMLAVLTEKNQEKRREKMLGVTEILEAVRNLTVEEQKKVLKEIRLLPTEKKIYPEKKVVEKDGYRVTVKWHGVFTRFTYAIAQAGDCKGKTILKAEGHKWKLGPKLGIYYNRVNNLDCYDEIYKRFIRKAENKNVKLDTQKLALVLAEALSPYSLWARMKIKDMEKVGYIPVGSGGRS